MAASVGYRPQERTLGMVMKEVDRNLALFLEMRSRENEKNDLLLPENMNGSDDIIEMKCEKEFVNFQNHVDERSDLDWFLIPPDFTAILSTGEDNPMSLKGENEYSVYPAISSQSADANSSENSGSLNNKSMHSSNSIGSRSSVTGNRRPNSSGGRKSTPFLAPTARSSLPAMTESTRQPTSASRALLTSTKAMPPDARSRSRIRSVTPTPNSRVSIPSNSKSTSRSVTPTPIVRSSELGASKSIPRSVTPTPTTRTSVPTTSKSKSRSVTPTSTARSSVPSTSKSTSRSTTPTRKRNPIMTASTTQSSKLEVTGSSVSKNPVLSRGVSPTVKSRPPKLPEMPGLLADAPDLATTSMIKRSKSAPRGQPSTARSSFSLNESNSSKKPGQQSCSPSRTRRPNAGTQNVRPALLSKSQGYRTGSEDLNPVLIGTRMVERVVNMRKLVPPRQADNASESIASKKSSLSQENTGFGRSLSKKSLDMAIRHMDITRSIASDEHHLAVNPSTSAPPRARP